MFFLEYKLALLLLGGVVGAVVALHRRSLRSREAAVARDLDALARSAEGGRPEAALAVTTSALVEPRATALPCAACGGRAMKVEHHTAEEHAGERLRRVRVGCDDCGASRAVFVKIVALA